MTGPGSPGYVVISCSIVCDRSTICSTIGTVLADQCWTATLLADTKRSSVSRTLAKRHSDQAADDPPAGVDLEPTVRQPRRRRSGVMVVVQAFAGSDQGQPLEVAGPVGVRAPAEVVSDGVDRSRAAEVQVDVHEGGEETDQRAEENDQNADPEAETEEGVIVEPPVGSCGRQVLGVAGHGLGVAGLAPVQADVAALHLDPAEQHGGVRVALDVGERVMLAVHGDPLSRADARGDPHEEPKHLGDRAFEGHGLVGEPAVQEHRRGHEGDERHAETDGHTRADDPQHRVNLPLLPTGR